MELCRPSDSHLEHVDFECLFSCLSLRILLRVFGSLLLERRVIFTADKLRSVESFIPKSVARLHVRAYLMALLKIWGCTEHPSSTVYAIIQSADIRCKHRGCCNHEVTRNAGGPDPHFLNKCKTALVLFREQAREIFWGQYVEWFRAGASLFVLQEKASGSQKEQPH